MVEKTELIEETKSFLVIRQENNSILGTLEEVIATDKPREQHVDFDPAAGEKEAKSEIESKT